MQNRPAPSVLIAFGCDGSAEHLAGGQGSTWRSGDLVLKPMFDPQGAVWEAETLSQLPQVGYRVALPVRSRDGQWVHDGWTAYRFLDGFCPKGTHLSERLSAARALHRDLLGFARPAHFDLATDPWDLADKIAFGFAQWTPDPRIAPCLARFRRLEVETPKRWQVIHGDLAGNFLLLVGHDPAIIDFTPKWSPVGFGEAVMAVDVCLWEGVPLAKIVELLSLDELRLLPLAVTRRLLEVDTRHKLLRLPDDVFGQVSAYDAFAGALETYFH